MNVTDSYQSPLVRETAHWGVGERTRRRQRWIYFKALPHAVMEPECEIFREGQQAGDVGDRWWWRSHLKAVWRQKPSLVNVPFEQPPWRLGIQIALQFSQIG